MTIYKILRGILSPPKHDELHQQKRRANYRGHFARFPGKCMNLFKTSAKYGEIQIMRNARKNAANSLEMPKRQNERGKWTSEFPHSSHFLQFPRFRATTYAQNIHKIKKMREREHRTKEAKNEGEMRKSQLSILGAFAHFLHCANFLVAEMSWKVRYFLYSADGFPIIRAPRTHGNRGCRLGNFTGGGIPRVRFKRQYRPKLVAEIRAPEWPCLN